VSGGHTWARGLPNWYFHEDMSSHPSRLAGRGHGTSLREIAWIEVGGDPAILRRHLGEEAFEALPVRFVDGPGGLYGLGILTARDEEIAIRRDSAAPTLAAILGGTAT
jgi:hypothetical protein